MGYRMNIVDQKTNKHIELGKLYGYLDESIMENFRSIKYLLRLRGLGLDSWDLEDYIDSFKFSSRNEIRMSGYEFRLFIDLYQADINSVKWDSEYISYPENYKISDYYPEFNDIYFSDGMKLVYWE